MKSKFEILPGFVHVQTSAPSLIIQTACFVRVEILATTRLCANAEPRKISVSDTSHGLSVPYHLEFAGRTAAIA
jgi:hypothetical protein